MDFGAPNRNVIGVGFGEMVSRYGNLEDVKMRVQKGGEIHIPFHGTF